MGGGSGMSTETRPGNGLSAHSQRQGGTSGGQHGWSGGSWATGKGREVRSSRPRKPAGTIKVLDFIE